MISNNLPVVSDSHEIVNNLEVQDDLKITRTNIREIIDKTTDAVDKVVDLADTSQSARYYEVLNGLLKTSLEANRELLDLHRKKKEIVQSTGGPPSKTVNNLIMTSNDMLKLIKGEGV